MKRCHILASALVPACLLVLIIALFPKHQAQAKAAALAFPPADLAIAKLDSPDPVQISSLLTYTLVVNNRGPAGAIDVQITDTLPSGVIFAFAEASQGTCSGTQTITCTLGSLSNGDIVTVTIVVTAPGTVGVIYNTASVTGSQPDPHLTNNTDIQSTTVIAIDSADLAIVKTDWPDPVLSNGALTYVITVTNHGPAAVNNARLTDTLPSGVSLVSMTPGQGTCSADPLVCDLGSLANGDRVTVTIVVTAPQTAGMINNTAQAGSAQPDQDEANNTDTESTTVVAPPAADLSVVKVGRPEPVSVSGALTYVITVTNLGPSPATGVRLTDTLPLSTTFIAALPAQGTCQGTASVICDLGDLNYGEFVTVTIVVTAPAAAGTIINTVNVRADQLDLNAQNNTDTASTLVAAADSADLLIVKDDSMDPAPIGCRLSYIITVTNHGPAVATGVRMTDTLPAGVSLVSAMPGQGACSGADPVICELGNLPAGSQVAVTLVVTTPIHGGWINNTASVAGEQPDPDMANNTDAESTRVAMAAGADLAIDKADLNDPVVAGGILTYIITATNQGTIAATGVTVTDTLPLGVTYVSAASSQGNCGGASTIVCTLGSLDAGSYATITITVRAPMTLAGIDNVAAIKGSQADPNPANNSDTEHTAVIFKLFLPVVLKNG